MELEHAHLFVTDDAKAAALAEQTGEKIREIAYKTLGIYEHATTHPRPDPRAVAWNYRLWELMHAIRQSRETAQETQTAAPKLAHGAANGAALAVRESFAIAQAIDEEVQKIATAQNMALWTLYRESVLSLTEPTVKDPNRHHAEDLWLKAEAQAIKAQNTARRAEELKRIIWQSARTLAALPLEEDGAPIARDLGRRKLQMTEEVTRTLDCTESATLHATRAAIVARNQPDDKETMNAAIMALANCIQSAKAAQETLIALRDCLETPEEHTNDDNA